MGMTHTGNDGTFLVEHLGPGEYTVFAFYAGYLSSFNDLLALNKDPAKQRILLARLGTVTVHGSETENFDVALQRGATLTGHVLFSDGTPAISVALTLESTVTAASEPRDPKQAMAEAAEGWMSDKPRLTTDDRGQFRLVGLPPGKYRLAASQPVAASDYGEADPDGLSGLVSLGLLSDPRSLHFYSGGTIHRADATVYDLKAADTVEDVEIILPLNAFHDVRGVVETADGKVAVAGAVTLTDESDSQLSYRTRVRDDGSFLLHQVPAGSYQLEVKESRPGEKHHPENTSGNPPEAQSAGGNAHLGVLVQDADVTDLVLTVSAPADQTSTGVPASVAVPQP